MEKRDVINKVLNGEKPPAPPAPARCAVSKGKRSLHSFK